MLCSAATEGQESALTLNTGNIRAKRCGVGGERGLLFGFPTITALYSQSLPD